MDGASMNENNALGKVMRMIAGIAAAALCIILVRYLVRYISYEGIYPSISLLKDFILPLIRLIGLFIIAWGLLLSGRPDRLRLGFILAAIGFYKGIFFGGDSLVNVWRVLIPPAYLMPVLAEPREDSRRSDHCSAIFFSAAYFLIYFCVLTFNDLGYSSLPGVLLSCTVPVFFVLPQLGQPLFSKT